MKADALQRPGEAEELKDILENSHVESIHDRSKDQYNHCLIGATQNLGFLPKRSRVQKRL